MATASGRIAKGDRAAHEPSRVAPSRPSGEHPLRVLDLFSGIGGFSLGLERSGGFETVAFCEIDPFCRKVLAKHWPEVPCFDDVRTLRGDAVAPVDIISGGFPCQDLSNAGLRGGIEAERSGLWAEIARLAGELRPSYIIVENVSALLNGPTEWPGRWFGRVLGNLAALGYDAEWDCIPASYVGAPRQRDRVWIVAYPAQERQSEARQLRRIKLAEWLPRCGQTSFPANDREERAEVRKPQQVSGFPAFPWCQDVRRAEDLRGRSDLPPPLFRGSVDGIPNWVDRVGSCGNAVVPQIPELIGRAILAAIEAERQAA